MLYGICVFIVRYVAINSSASQFLWELKTEYSTWAIPRSLGIILWSMEHFLWQRGMLEICPVPAPSHRYARQSKYNTSGVIREEFYMNILFCGISFLMGTMSQATRKQEAALSVLACLRCLDTWFLWTMPLRSDHTSRCAILVFHLYLVEVDRAGLSSH